MNLDTTVYSIHIIITTIIILYSQVTYVSCSDPSVTKRYPRKKSCLPRQINLQLVRSTKNEQLLYAQVCALGGSRVRIPDITRSAIANCIILIGFKTRSQSQVHQNLLANQSYKDCSKIDYRENITNKNYSDLRKIYNFYQKLICSNITAIFMSSIFSEQSLQFSMADPVQHIALYLLYEQ